MVADHYRGPLPDGIPTTAPSYPTPRLLCEQPPSLRSPLRSAESGDRAVGARPGRGDPEAEPGPRRGCRYDDHAAPRVWCLPINARTPCSSTPWKRPSRSTRPTGSRNCLSGRATRAPMGANRESWSSMTSKLRGPLAPRSGAGRGDGLDAVRERGDGLLDGADVPAPHLADRADGDGDRGGRRRHTMTRRRWSPTPPPAAASSRRSPRRSPST